MSFNPNASQLNQEQILQQVFDPANNALRTDAFVQVDTINADLTVVIKAASGDDISIASQDGTKHLAINSDGSINTSGTSTVTGTVNTNLNGLNTFQTSQYTVGLSSVQITPTPLTNRSSLSIKAINTANNIIYVGNNSGVTTSTGYPLFNGDSIQLDMTPSQQIWVIASAANQLAFALELGG